MNLMTKAICRYLFPALEAPFRLSISQFACALGKWPQRVFMATMLLGLLTTAAFASAQPSNLGDEQVFQTNTELQRANTQVIAASTYAEQHPRDTDAQYALAVALDRMGDLQTLRARQPFPYNAGYRAALELARNNLKAHPYTSKLMPKVQRLEPGAAADSEQILWSYRDAARRYFTRARIVYQQLVALQPNNSKWQQALAVNYTRTNPGHVGVEEVRAYYQPALDILLRLAKSAPGNQQLQRDLAATYEEIADRVNSMTGTLPAEYHEALAIRIKVLRSNETNPLFVRELAVTFGKIGEALVMRGKWAAARDAVTDQFGLYQDLAALDPGNNQWQRELAVAHMDFAAIKNDNNGPGAKLEAEVLAHYAQALAIRTRLIQVEPSNAQWQMDLVASHETMARFYDDRGLDEKTLASYIEAQRQMAKFAQRYPNDRGWLFYQLYFYFSIGSEYRAIQSWAAPHSLGGKFPEPGKFKAAADAQDEVFENMRKIIDTLVRMTDAPVRPA